MCEPVGYSRANAGVLFIHVAAAYARVECTLEEGVT